MKSNTICQVILAGSIILASCQSNNSAKQDESQQTMNETVMNKVTDCKISAGNITFTNAINGAENCVKLLDDGALEFHCTEGLDFFSDPNGKLSNTTLPILLVPVENTKPFTLLRSLQQRDCIMQPTFLSILVIHFGRNWHLNRMNMVTTVLLQ